jgi:hypothetical protein
MVVFNLAQAARHGADLLAIRQGSYKDISASNSPGRMTVDTGMRFAVVDADGQARGEFTLADKTALVFVFSTLCGACNENMPRWLDLVVELQSRSKGIPVYALSADTSFLEPVKYWDALGNSVELLLPADRLQALAVLGVTSTPTTIAVRNGRVVAAHVGALGDWRRRYLLEHLRGN